LVARFRGRERAFFGLLIRGALLLMITLGIYRFWLSTDIRRFLWGNTEIAGDSLEYTGTPWELLIGFLMAIALMIPIYALLFLAALDLGLIGRFSGVIGFASLAILGQYARYRARRYRLSRTVFRGVRLFQTGSGLRYALIASLWWAVTVITLGLAYPWMQAALERYKMRNTHFGNLDGHFEGTGTGLFLRGIILWLIVVGPFFAGVFMALAAINWESLGSALEAGTGSDLWSRIEGGNPSLGAAAVLAGSGIGWGVVAAALLYPAFRATMLRWWVDGARLGELRAHSRLRGGQIYRVYFRFLGYSILLSIVISIVGGVVFAAFGGLSAGFGKSTFVEIAAVFLLIFGYVFAALAYSAVYQATVTIRFWRLTFETADVCGLHVLDSVEARGAPASPFGEGLADALNVGGL
jgi:uncharacterized membrane protein YjgN (DUF898 family)